MRATEIGARARALLGESTRRWAVLAALSGAIYIESERGEILWLAHSRNALHGRAVLLERAPALAELPRHGASCWIRDRHLHAGERFVADLRGAVEWRPVIGERSGGGVTDWGRRLMAGVHHAARQSGPRASLFHTLLGAPLRVDPGLHREGFFSLFAHDVVGLRSLRIGRDLPSILEGARGLVGLGEGLTPSGDDLMGGYLFALRLLDRASEQPLGIDWARIEEWLSSVSRLTGKLSHAMLVDHGRGEAADPVWALLCHAIGGAPEKHLAGLALRVSEIGHASGWGILTGIHCGASAAVSLAAQSGAGTGSSAA